MQNDTCNRSTWGYNIELPDSRLEIRGEGEKDRDRDREREAETESVFMKNDFQINLINNMN